MKIRQTMVPAAFAAALVTGIFASAGVSAGPRVGWPGAPVVSNSPIRDGIAPETRILTDIDESQLVELIGNTRGEANARYDRGRVDDGMVMGHLQLLLRRSTAQARALVNRIDEETNPKSENFHKWLGPAQFGSKYGVSQADLASIRGWLEGHGFIVNVVYPNGMLIDFTGTAGQIRETFHTEVHKLSVNGVPHVANMSNPRIPAALVPVVAGIVSLHDFKPHNDFKPKTKPLKSAQRSTPKPDDTTGNADSPYLVVPADLATIYNLNPLYAAAMTGQGQTIAVLEYSDSGVDADWATFRSTFGLDTAYPNGTLTTIHPLPPTGTNNCADPGIVDGDEVEVELDAQWASAAAPNATIVIASCASSAAWNDGGNSASGFGSLTAMANMLNTPDGYPAIMSMSSSACESNNGAAANMAYYDLVQQAASQGVSVFVSSGDAGATCDYGETANHFGTDVSAFATAPYAVGVGGTDFLDTAEGLNSSYWNQTISTGATEFGSALSYIPEQPWNDSCANQILANYVAFGTAFGSGNAPTYGPSSFCNSAAASDYNDLDTSAGSGGPSDCFTGQEQTYLVADGTCAGLPKPAWQTLVGNPADGVRDIPDVSLFAADGLWGHYYVLCDSYTADTGEGNAPCVGQDPSTWNGGGGTSFSAPIMAAMQALINESAGGAQGLPNPAYYSIAAAEYGAAGSSACNSSAVGGPAGYCAFYDVTQGDITVDCVADNYATGNPVFNCFLDGATYGVSSVNNTGATPTITYGAGTGWDFATGIGTVNAFNLVAAYTGASAPSVTASGGSLVLNWVAPYDTVTSYNVYQSAAAGGEGGTPVLTGISGTTATINGLAGGTYYFEVTAINASTGAESVKSTEVSASLPLPTISLSTSAIKFGSHPVGTTSAAQTITVTNTGVSGLQIGNSLAVGGANPSAFALSGDTCSNSLIAAGSSCSFALQFMPGSTGPFTGSVVINSNAASSPNVITMQGTGLVSKPTAPTGVTVMAGNAAATVSWNASANAVSYDVYQRTAGVAFSIVATGVTGTSTIITGLPSGSRYDFAVTANNSSGASPKSEGAGVYIPNFPTVTISFAPVSVTKGTSSTLTWSVGDSTSATTCEAGGSSSVAKGAVWSGTKSPKGGSETLTKNVGTFNYTLECSNVAGSSTGSATLTVTP